MLISLILFEMFIISALSIGIGSSNQSPPAKILNRAEIKVLFDFTKDEDAGTHADWTIDGGYSDFANALRNEGFVVDSLGTGQGTITSSDLQGYNVFVIPEPQDAFSSNETNAIVDFVHNGGGLVYIADHNGSDRNSDGWDSWHIWNNNLNFDERFNITLVSAESGASSNNEITDIAPVPVLTDNVNSFGIWDGATMQVRGNAKAAAYQTLDGTKYAVLAYSYYGNGRVVVHGDSSTFDDGSKDNSTNNKNDKLYNAWGEYDDATLGVNLVKWAAGVNTTSSNSTSIKSYSGSSPSVSYGNGNYIVAFENGTSVEGYFVNASTGEQSKEIQFYNYGDGIRTAYNPDGKNFTVVSYDYALSSGVPKYHKILLRFVNPDSENMSSGITVSNDANKSVDVAYGNHEILIVWTNLTREKVNGIFYNTQTETFGQIFTIASGITPKYSVAVGFDSKSSKFLVVWGENYNITGAFVNTSNIANITFPSTSSMKKSQFSVAGQNGEFMVTYRNGTFSTAQGAYFIIIHYSGTVSNAHEISNYSAQYCGRADVVSNNSSFMVIFSDARNGNADVFMVSYNLNGTQKGNEMNITTSSNIEESPAGAGDGSTMLVTWNNYVSSSNQQIEGKFYPSTATIPELGWLLPILLIIMVIVTIIRRKQ